MVRTGRSVLVLLVALASACGDDDGMRFVFDGAPPPPDMGPALDVGPRDLGGGDAGGGDCPSDAVCVRIDATEFPAVAAMPEITIAASQAWPVYYPTPIATGVGAAGDTVELRGLGTAEARYWLVGIAGSRIGFADVDELDIPDDLGRTITLKFVPWLASVQVGRGGNMGDADVLIFAALSLFDPGSGEQLTGSAATVTLVDGATETPMPFGRSQYGYVPDPAERSPAALRYTMRVDSSAFATSPFDVEVAIRLLSGPATIIAPDADATVPHDSPLRLVWGPPPDAGYVIPCVLAGPDFSLDTLVWGCDQARFDHADVPESALDPGMTYRIGIQSGRTTSRLPGAVGYSVVDSFIYVSTPSP